MSLDDRDWYRDLQLERQGLKPRWQLWKFKRPPAEVHRNPYYVKAPEPWHPVLQVVLFVIICLATFLILKLFQ